ncbi:hypothetical protein [Miniphocaeibacter halophilus]|uniref:Uncharacterized protein n=1 Tax=Miniphocaeibacter halophilus TaxID=2931922 RepID=A0AC61MPN0_9FIRM|nr:hypothetical protein [Miniphocaeibacter halophilus]QQK07497.1 hypothetical protein JFY71_09365 [Miniphocaeibacter halophilus]
MKRIKIIFLLFAMSISAVLITSCMNPEENDIKSSIMAPEPNNIMLEGTWKVIDVKQNADNMETNTDHITENLYISKKLFKFGNKSILSPNFTSKYINTNKFFNINYPGINPNNFTSNDNVEIVTISESEGISQEIIKLEENKILLIADGYLYFLERMSNTVDESIYLKYKEENIKTNIEAYNGKIGLSLSIINRAEEDASSYTDYSSYYVYYDNYKKENATLEAYKEPGIFLPNKNDFNVITFDEIWDGENYEGKLFKTLVTDDNIAASNKILDSDVPFELTFVSDKYISYSSSDVIIPVTSIIE